jgi:hypothetical protein
MQLPPDWLIGRGVGRAWHAGYVRNLRFQRAWLRRCSTRPMRARKCLARLYIWATKQRYGVLVSQDQPTQKKQPNMDSLHASSMAATGRARWRSAGWAGKETKRAPSVAVWRRLAPPPVSALLGCLASYTFSTILLSANGIFHQADNHQLCWVVSQAILFQLFFSHN